MDTTCSLDSDEWYLTPPMFGFSNHISIIRSEDHDCLNWKLVLLSTMPSYKVNLANLFIVQYIDLITPSSRTRFLRNLENFPIKTWTKKACKTKYFNHIFFWQSQLNPLPPYAFVKKQTAYFFWIWGGHPPTCLPDVLNFHLFFLSSSQKKCIKPITCNV